MKRPNILITIADDQRHDALGPQVLTPELDRFAASGCRFTQAHVMGSMVPAVCVASRAMLMTGRSIFGVPTSLTYGDYMGRDEGSYIPPPEGVPLLGELFSKAGYDTHAVGKWHNGLESFNRSFRGGSRIFLGGMGDQYRIPLFDFDPTGVYPDEKKYVIPRFSTDLFTESACAFLSNRKKDTPFFLYTAFTSPHDPRTPPKEWLDLYPPEKIPLPENFLAEHPFDNGELKIRDEGLAPFPRTPEVIRQHIAEYYAMVSHLDHSIGKIHQTLKDSGEWENTIVIHTADHGLAVGQHGLMGKQNMYDHSMRIPLIFGGAFSSPGKKSEALCYLHDLFPTLCEAAGIGIPESVDGKSLAPLLQGKNDSHREVVFSAYRKNQRMLSNGKRKLIAYVVEGAKRIQFFDLEKDPKETHDLSGEIASQKEIEVFKRLFREEQKRLKDPLEIL